MRFLGDPGFRIGDLVLFVREDLPANACVPPSWGSAWSAEFWAQYWRYLLCLYGLAPTAKPLALAGVVSRSSELCTSLVEFDRDLDGLLTSDTEAYAAYRVLGSAGKARRLTKIVTAPGTRSATVSAPCVSSSSSGARPFARIRSSSASSVPYRCPT